MSTNPRSTRQPGGGPGTEDGRRSEETGKSPAAGALYRVLREAQSVRLRARDQKSVKIIRGCKLLRFLRKHKGHSA